jgi:DedD protein
MPLPSFLKPKEKQPADRRKPASTPADDSGPVQAARTRARRRLVGAVVLLGVGIVGFPILFETQPRPVAMDVPIETPQRDRGVVTETAPQPLKPAALPPAEPVQEPAPAAAASAPTSASPASAPAPAPAPAPPALASAPVPAVPPARPDSGTRARALLEGSAASAPAAGRFVVQVGAYSDANALREVRAKVEKLGLKTYTQMVQTDAGPRTRVRVGPFTTREEAEGAAGRLRGGGLPAAILTL